MRSVNEDDDCTSPSILLSPQSGLVTLPYPASALNNWQEM